MRILLSPDKLADFNLTPQDVIAAVQEQKLAVCRRTVRTGTARRVSALYLFGQHPKDGWSMKRNSATSFLKAMTRGGILRLKDVARIELGAQGLQCQLPSLTANRRSLLRSICKPGKRAGDGRVDQTENGRSFQSFPEGISYEIPYDTTVFVDVSINEVIHIAF